MVIVMVIQIGFYLLVLALVAVVHSVPVKNFFYGTSTDEYVYRYILNVRTGVVESEKGSQYEVMADLHVRPGDPIGNAK